MTMMFELGMPVLIDSEIHGTIVGCGYDMREELPCFDVRLGQSIIVYNIKPHRLTVAGSGRKDVIGRDIPTNSKRDVKP